MITRLAPSPTGALHLGNARTFLINWLLARQAGGTILLRVEDIDGPRIKPESVRQAIDDLQWLGIDWDGKPVVQSSRIPLYEAALQKLITAGAVYPCTCSRKEIEQAASAPHADDGAAIYPGTCRGRYAGIHQAREQSGRDPALRFRVDERELAFDDDFAGRRHFNPATQLGDFVTAKADGTPAYQLAVVVDDADMGVTHIVRGDDLLDSTPRQILLYRALGLETAIPRYMHVPLVVGTDGRRLAKRHGDTRLATYRERGMTPGRMRSMLARSMGIDAGAEVTIDEMLQRFTPTVLPRTQIVYHAATDELA